MRAALYARYSTDEQRPESIVDQIETCRRYCASKGWNVIGTYADAAISGSSSQRQDFERLKRDAERKAFDVVVVESIDRLSRRLADVASFHDVLSFRSQKLHATDKGEISSLLAGILGSVAQGFLEDLKVKTKRGLRGKVLSGLSAGGLGYGYKVDPRKLGSRCIDAFEASVINRVFLLYATGIAPRTIAAKLNAEGVPGPGGRFWGDTTIRGQADRGTGLLNNAAYIGIIEWNRCSYTRDLATGRRVARPNPREEWEVMDVPDLRIVDDELWQRVKKRQAAVRTEMARDEAGNPLNRAHRAKHLLSGCIFCGCCGAPYAVRNGRQVGCSNYRSKGICRNAQLVDRRDLESTITEALRRQWLTSDNIEEIHAAAVATRAVAPGTAEASLIRLHGSLKQTQSKIDRVVAAIAELGHSAALIGKLQELEAQAADVTMQIKDEEAANAPAPPLDRTRLEMVLSVLAESLPLLLEVTDDPAIARVRELVRGMIEKIVVTPGEGRAAQVEIHGRYAGVMAAAGLQESFEEATDANAPEAGASGVLHSVVAGAGFEPAAFRL